MNMRSLPLSLVALLGFLSTEMAFAEWSASFIPPTPSKPALLIDLPDDLDIATLTGLAVELDGIDITSLISFEGKDFSYTPIKPLENGEHVLRLLTLNPDSSNNEKAKWSFNIDSVPVNINAENAQQMRKAEAWLRSSSFAADTLTEFSTRSHQHNIGAAPDHSIISGSGNVQGALKGENWSVNARSNYLVQSDKDLALTGNAFDIGEYDIAADYTGESVTTGLTLGHHDVGLNSLLFSSFQRRGVSARVADNNDRVAANVFAFTPQSLAGASEFTGLNDSNNRLEGISTTIKPFSSDDDAFKMTALYFDGQGATGGIGIGGEEEVSTSSGYGLIVEKSLVQGKIDLRGEYARAEYDADGNLDVASEDKSDAISFLIEARPFDNTSFYNKGMDLVVGTKYERIDTFFESLANQGLAADRDAITVYSNLYWGSLSANLQLGHETNNVDDLASSPTDRLRNALWNTNYAFDPQVDSYAWLGAPYLSFSGFLSSLDREKTPSGYIGNDTDNTSNSFSLGGGSSYENWNWSVSHTYATVEDHANNASDTVSNFSSVSTGWTVSDRLGLNADVQYGVFENKDNDENNYATNVNVGLRSVLVQDKLDLSLNYNLNLAGGSDDSPDKHIANMALGWTIKKASTNNPGLALALRGSLEKTNGNTINQSDETEYQLFAVFKVTAPISFEH